MAVAYDACADDLKTLAADHGAAMPDSEWDKLFSAGALDSLLGDVHRKQAARKPVSIAAIAQEQSAAYALSKSRGSATAKPFLEELLGRNKEASKEAARKKQEQDEVAEYYNELQRKREDDRERQVAEAERAIRTAKIKDELEEQELRTLEEFKVEVETIKKGNAEEAKKHHAQVVECKALHKSSYFENMATLGLLCAQAGHEADSADHKLLLSVSRSEAAAVLGIFDGRLLPEDTLSESLSGIVDRLAGACAVGASSCALYILKDACDTGELATMLTALAARSLAAKVLTGFYAGDGAMELALWIHSPNVPAPDMQGPFASAVLHSLLTAHMTVQNLSKIQPRERLLKMTQDGSSTARKVVHAVCEKERSQEFCARFLEACGCSNSHLQGKVVVYDMNGEVGSWAKASMALCLRLVGRGGAKKEEAGEAAAAARDVSKHPSKKRKTVEQK